MSEPCIVSHPAQGAPACNAVYFATVGEALIPSGKGLAIISIGGLVLSSKTVQV